MRALDALVRPNLSFSGGSEFSRVQLVGWARLFCYLSVIFVMVLIELIHKDFTSLRSQSYFYLILSVGLAAHIVNDYRPYLLKAIPYFDAFIIFSAMLVFESASPILLVLAVINASLCGFAFGPSSSLRMGVFSAGLVNIGFIYLKSHGVAVPEASILIFNVAILAGSGLGGFLSFELQDLSIRLEERSRDLRLYKGLSDLLIDNMGAGLLAVDEVGRIVRANKGAAKIFEMVGIESNNLYEISDPLWAFVRAAKKTEQHELEHENIQGRKMILETIISPLKVRDEKDSGWVVMVQNRTQIKNLEAALRQKEKLAAVGQLAAGIAHEIRNPLASISGSVQLLAGTLDTATPEDKKLLAIMIKEIDRLNNLITEFLDYVRPDIDANEPINLDELLQDVLNMCSVNNRLPEGVKQVVELNTNLNFLGHHDKLKQAFLNIIINAYQAMAESETKKLKVHSDVLEGQIRIEISDTGTGISKDGVRRIFEPFHTTKAKGTGLGLAITHKIFESHGIDVQVSSTVGKGTSFLIRFPVDSH